MFGPVITTEAHLAFASLFLNPMAQLLVTRSLFPMIPSTLLVFAWARFRLARTYSWHSSANSHS